MAKNIDVINAFLNGENEPRTANLRIEGNKLISYDTVIAERDGRNTIVMNVTKYSTSTTRIQNALIKAFDDHHEPMVMREVSDIEIGAGSLV